MKEFFYYWSIIIVESRVQSQKGILPYPKIMDESVKGIYS